jgi:F0F1-type ATP synthase epsilon subunit
MVENRLTILTEQAKPVAELDRAAAERALVQARAMPSHDDTQYAARQRAIQSAEAQIRLASRPAA